jgi:hypothetical protein
MEKDAEGINAHLTKKWNQVRVCPLCGESNWVIAPDIVKLKRYNEKSVKGRLMDLFPVVPISCTNCDNVIFISAT